RPGGGAGGRHPGGPAHAVGPPPDPRGAGTARRHGRAAARGAGRGPDGPGLRSGGGRGRSLPGPRRGPRGAAPPGPPGPHGGAGGARAAVPGVTEVLAALAVAAVLVWAGGNLTVAPERLLSFLAALILLYQPAKELGRASQFATQGAAAAERLLEVLETPPLVTDAP